MATALLLTLAVGGCSSAADGPANEPPRSAPNAAGSIWVADEAGDSLTVIDAATDKVVTTLTGIEAPHNVQVGHDGATVYAVSGADNVVLAIDAATYNVTATAPTGPAPAHVIEATGIAGNDKVYVTNSGDGTVSVYRAPELQPARRITVGGMPHGLRAADDGSVIAVANTMAGALDVIDPATDTVLGSVPVGAKPAQVAVTADGRYAYAGTTGPSAVVKVDLDARTVVATAPVPSDPVQLYLTPDEGTVISANQGTREAPGDTASLIDTAAMTVRSTATTGSGPHGVVVDTAGTRAWVTNTFDDTVSVIDLSTASVLATTATGAGPNGVSYSQRPPPGDASPTVTLDIPAPAAGGAENQPDHHGH